MGWRATCSSTPRRSASPRTRLTSCSASSTNRSGRSNRRCNPPAAGPPALGRLRDVELLALPDLLPARRTERARAGPDRRVLAHGEPARAARLDLLLAV